MKTLKFRPYLIKFILDGSKTITWRLFDDKDLKENDEIKLINWDNGEVFAEARIIFIKETTFSGLCEDDRQGHEKFPNDEEMYKEYSEYYNQEISKSTPLKVIRFILI